MAAQLAVTLLDFERVAVHAERRADDGGLQVIGHEHPRHPAEVMKGFGMQLQPRRHRLVKDDASKHLAAEAQHHHEDPGFAWDSSLGVIQQADVAEVHLRHLPRVRLDPNVHVLSTDAAGLPNPLAQTLERRATPGKVLVLEPQRIVDPLRSLPRL